MTDWKNYKFVLAWVKENLDEYQFLTAEAKQLKTEMTRNTLETEADLVSFGRNYEDMLRLVERNPFTAQNADGKAAAILVNDFYFYFYPTKQDMQIPIGLQIELGATNTAERALEFKERLTQSASVWNNEAEKSRRIRLPEMNGEAEEYRLLFEKGISHAGFMLRQCLLLGMLFLCLGGNAFIYFKGLYKEYDKLHLTAACLVTVVSVTYLLKSVKWIIRERTRHEYIKLWKSAQTAEKAENTVEKGFRTTEALQKILDCIETRQYHGGISTLPVSSEKTVKRKEISLLDLEQKKVRKKLYTVRTIHLFTMLAAVGCFCLYASAFLPDRVAEIKSWLSDKMDEKIISPWFSSATAEEQKAALETVDLELRVLKDDTYSYSDADKAQISGIYEKGKRLSFVGAEKNADGILMYHFTNDALAEGYIEASEVLLKDVNQIVPTKLEVLDSAGNLKKEDAYTELMDGASDTSVELEAGDVIRMTFSDAVTLRSFYIRSGDTANGEDGMIRSGRLAVNEGEPYIFTFLGKENLNGFVISLPEEPMNVLEIKVSDISGSSDKSSVSELILCR